MLVTTLYWPRGPGPFPLWVFNHGKSYGDIRAQGRSAPIALARMLVRHGYVVAAPNRKGFADSGGQHVSHWLNPLSGALTCARDIDAVVAHLCRDTRIDASHVVVSGHSYGALGTFAYGMKPHRGVRALVNFMGGLRAANEEGWRAPLVHAFRYFGRRSSLPTLWLYAENDSFWSMEDARQMCSAYREHGAPAELVNLGTFKDDAHHMVLDEDGVGYWWPHVRALLQQLTEKIEHEPYRYRPHPSW